MRKTCLLLLTALSLINIQKTLAGDMLFEGFIIDLQGDTLHGYIEDKDWVTTPEIINFRNDATSISTEYTANDIMGFYSNETGRKFIASAVSVNISSHKADELSSSTAPTMKDDTIFLEVLLTGRPYSLYKYMDQQNRPHFFIGVEQEGIVELINHKFRKSEDEISKNLKYIGQLKYYLQQCDKIAQTNTFRYSDVALTKLFNSYYDCINAAPIYTKVKKKSPIYINFFGGAAMTSTLVKDTGNPYWQILSDQGAQWGPSAGVDARIVLSNKHELISFIAGLNYYSRLTSYEASFTDDNIIQRTHHISHELKSHFLDLSFGVDFHFLQEKPVSPFLRVGAASHLVVSNSSKLTDRYYTVNNPGTVTESNPSVLHNEEPEKWTITPYFAAGMEFHDFFVMASLVYNYKGYSQTFLVSDSELHVMLNVGYQLQINKKKTQK